jgi:hypothetical protein
VPTHLKRAWQRKLGGRLSAVVIADGTVYVASIDTHTVWALDAVSGEVKWSYTTGGRVDSPPTVEKGRVLFGSADGYVYCLRAADGKLAWRFRAAPEDHRMTSYGQVESVWPVHGSVLLQHGVVHCVAGRSMFLDGGLRYLRIDAATGRKLSETIFDDRDPTSGENLQVHVKVRNMPVGLPDILSADEQFVYMRSQRFDPDGTRHDIPPHAGNDDAQAAVQKGVGVHLFSPTGFLDDAWVHRSYWVYGRTFAEGAGGWPRAGKYAPAGRILTVDENRVYGFGRKPEYYKWRTPLEYHLFSTKRDPEIITRGQAAKKKARPKQQQKQRKKKKKTKPKAKQAPRRQGLHPRYEWSRPVPLLARAMVLADKTLFIAGPPDVVDEEEAFRRIGDPAIQATLTAQDAALQGKQGALLWAVSAADGKKLAEYRLKELPIFDGMAAANRRLYMVTTDGTVLCFAGH